MVSRKKLKEVGLSAKTHHPLFGLSDKVARRAINRLCVAIIRASTKGDKTKPIKKRIIENAAFTHRIDVNYLIGEIEKRGFKVVD